MKKIKYTLILVVLYSFSLPHNTKLRTNGTVTYKLITTIKKYRPKYTNKEQASFEHTFITKITDAAKDLIFTLKFNQKESIYTHEVGMPDETVDNSSLEVAISLGGDGKYYQNRYENINYRQYFDDDANELILVTNKLSSPEKWKILKEIDTILGYKTIKAQSVKNKEYFVWFAPDIPVPFGPRNEGGLPGIILRSIDRYFTIEATDVKFNKKPIKIDRPIKGRRMTYQEKRAWDAGRIANLHYNNKK